MKSEGVHLVAVGARTPVGLCAESAAAAVRAGISRIGEHPILVDGGGGPLKAACDFLIDTGVTGPSRLIGLGVAALAEVAAKLVAHRPLPGALSVLLTLPESRPGFGATAAHAVEREMASTAFPGIAGIEVEAVGTGHAGALCALELACGRLAKRQCEVCIVGAIDSYLDADTLDWLAAEGRLTQEGVRGGFTPGEAAGMLALTTYDAALAWGLSSLAQIRGISIGEEPRSIDSPEGLLGEGLDRVVREATHELRVPQELVDDIYCDINGERHRTDEWGFMVLRSPHIFRDGTAYVTGAGSWGDVGAATGALNCMLAVEALRRGYAKGPLALVCGSSNDGLRAAALLERSGM